MRLLAGLSGRRAVALVFVLTSGCLQVPCDASEDCCGEGCSPFDAGTTDGSGALDDAGARDAGFDGGTDRDLDGGWDAGLSRDGGFDAGTDGGFRDAGVRGPLPTSAAIQPIKVVESFAACPTISLTWADGRTALLALDDRPLLPGTTSPRREGFALRWSANGAVTTERLTGCEAALVGLRPGVFQATLELVRSTESVVVGQVSVEVVSAAVADVRPTGLRLDEPFRVEGFPVQPPALSPSPLPVVAVGAAAPWKLTFDAAPGTSASVIPASTSVAFQLTAPGLITFDPTGTARGLSEGTTTAQATLIGRTVPRSHSSNVWAALPRQTHQLAFGLGRRDDGTALGRGVDATMNVLALGDCATLEATALVSSILPGTTEEHTFWTDVGTRATYSVTGTGLRAEGPTNRFCGIAVGEAAVVACHQGVCGSLGVLVGDHGNASLSASGPASVQLGGGARPGACVPFTLTARMPDGTTRDVRRSPALRMEVVNGPPAFVALDPATGLPRWSGTELCLEADPHPAPRQLRFTWGNAQATVTITLR